MSSMSKTKYIITNNHASRTICGVAIDFVERLTKSEDNLVVVIEGLSAESMQEANAFYKECSFEQLTDEFISAENYLSYAVMIHFFLTHGKITSLPMEELQVYEDDKGVVEDDEVQAQTFAELFYDCCDIGSAISGTALARDDVMYNNIINAFKDHSDKVCVAVVGVDHVVRWLGREGLSDVQIIVLKCCEELKEALDITNICYGKDIAYDSVLALEYMHAMHAPFYNSNGMPRQGVTVWDLNGSLTEDAQNMIFKIAQIEDALALRVACIGQSQIGDDAN